MRCTPRVSHLLIGLTLGTCPMSRITCAYAQPAAEAEAQPALQPPAEIAPPLSLAWLEGAAPDDDAAKRRSMAWEQVLDSVKPTPLPKPTQDPPAAVAGPAVVKLMQQADTAIERGEVFRAIEHLREAEQLGPQDLEVARRLGIAYMLSGNRVRGAAYLERALSYNHQDAGVLVLLCQHAAQRGELSKVLGLSEAMRAVGPGALADYYRAQALQGLGYTAASAQLLTRVVRDLEQMDDQHDAVSQKDPVVRRELRVLKTLEPQLKIELGDRYVSLGTHEKAAEVYATIDLKATVDPGAVIARRAYLALRSGQNDQAIEMVVGLLSLPGVTQEDAQLVGYLAAQGIPAKQLADRIEAAIQAQDGSLPLLSGLAAVAEPQRALSAISKWLADRPAEPALLRQAAELIDVDDADPADAEPLARLLALTADQMRDHPDQAQRFADAVVNQIDALVCLLRAVKRPELEVGQDPYRALLVALAYERAGRVGDAIAGYQQAIKIQPALTIEVRLPIAHLLIQADRPEEALISLRGGADSGWEQFELTIRAMAAIGDHREARQLIDAWLAQQGDSTRTRLLRAEMVAAAGNPRQACEDLRRLALQNPKDERPYKLALQLIDQYIESFPSIGNALNMRKQFIAMLNDQLPDSATARVERAFDFYDDPDQLERVEQLLLGALDSEPDNTLAWSMLIAAYDVSGDEDKAQAARRSIEALSPPGLGRMLPMAAKAIGDDDSNNAVRILSQALALDQEGVLPGPAMTGDDAASLIQLLSAAEPERDTEALSLAMVRRFPDNGLLNNALGYQWTVQGKNLLQAKAMIQRALDSEGESHSVLDSMAWVQYKLGAFAKAEAYQRRAIEMLREAQLRSNEQLSSSKAVLYDHMGDILYRQGDTASGIRHWQIARAQRLSPEDLLLDPELRTLSDRVDKKIGAVRLGEDPPVEPVPGPEAHGPDGHPAELKAPEEPAPDPLAQPEPAPARIGPADG